MVNERRSLSAPAILSRESKARTAIGGSHSRSFLILTVVLAVLFLAGCAGSKEKTVVRIRVRSNRVEAQEPSNQFSEYEPTATPTATATPQSTDLEIEVSSTQGTSLEPATPTPTPLALPLGRPDRIVIPSIDVETEVVPVYPKTNQIEDRWFQDWQTASYAAGYHEGTALLGQSGNTVISGHNNIEGAVFQNLYLIEPGARVSLYSEGFRYDYTVVDRFVLREKGAPVAQRLQNASWIRTTLDERLTLVSCWPPDGNDYRVIVVAKPSSQVAVGDYQGEQRTVD